jgi:hypothetical protein
MIEVGSIVQGNWSSIPYRVDHVWEVKGGGYWCINGKGLDNPRASGSFSKLGKRVGDEIEVGHPHPVGDRLLIIWEKGRSSKSMRQCVDSFNASIGQMELDLG